MKKVGKSKRIESEWCDAEEIALIIDYQPKRIKYFQGWIVNSIWAASNFVG